MTISLLLSSLVSAQIPNRNTSSLTTAIVDCGNKPNCVSSQASAQDKKIAPVTFNGTAEDFQNAVKEKIASLPRTKIVNQTDAYFHIEFTTAIMRFTDDVELYFDNGLIHVRSASRVGYSDLGANRNRVEEIRKLLQKN